MWMLSLLVDINTHTHTVSISGLSPAYLALFQVLSISCLNSVVLGPRLSCSNEYGIFLDQGLNLHLLHWPADP